MQGASIRVGWTMTEAGTTTVTNALGQAYHIIVAKRYTASGVTETGLVNVTMSLSSGLQAVPSMGFQSLARAHLRRIDRGTRECGRLDGPDTSLEPLSPAR